MALTVDYIYQYCLRLIKKNQSGNLKSTDFAYFWNGESSSYFSDLLGRFQKNNNGKEGINTGLIESNSINGKKRGFMQATKPEFAEWCGYGTETNELLKNDGRIYKQDLYFDFIQEFPDYAPRCKNAVSRIQFYEWLNVYSRMLLGSEAENGRDHRGKWMQWQSKIHEIAEEQDRKDLQSYLDF